LQRPIPPINGHIPRTLLTEARPAAAAPGLRLCWMPRRPVAAPFGHPVPFSPFDSMNRIREWIGGPSSLVLTSPSPGQWCLPHPAPPRPPHNARGGAATHDDPCLSSPSASAYPGFPTNVRRQRLHTANFAWRAPSLARAHMRASSNLVLVAARPSSSSRASGTRARPRPSLLVARVPFPHLSLSPYTFSITGPPPQSTPARSGRRTLRAGSASLARPRPWARRAGRRGPRPC
jgi:hypothetical protein